MAIVKIVSGGQTGADRGGLNAAIEADIPHGGYCPRGRRAEDGRIPKHYQLTEMHSEEYLARTEANVVDSDATVVFTYGAATGGSLRTVEFAIKYQRPWLHVNLSVNGHRRHVADVADWLLNKEPRDDQPLVPEKTVLNVAGSRGFNNPEMEDQVMHVMWDVLRQVNPDCAQLYPLRETAIT